MMCQCQSINCHKSTSLAEDIDNGEGYVCVGAGCIWKISTFLSILLRAKTSLEVKSILKNVFIKFQGKELLYMVVEGFLIYLFIGEKVI